MSNRIERDESIGPHNSYIAIVDTASEDYMGLGCEEYRIVGQQAETTSKAVGETGLLESEIAPPKPETEVR